MGGQTSRKKEQGREQGRDGESRGAGGKGKRGRAEWGGGAGGRRQGANKTPTNSKSEGGEQRSRKKEQEPSLAAHSEQLKTKHADRKQ